MPTSLGSQKSQENSRKISTSALLTMLKSLCGLQQTVENSSRDENTRSLYLPPEKSVCRSRSNSQNGTWNNRLFPVGSQRKESHPRQGHAEGSMTKRKDVFGFRDSPWKFLSIHPPRPESACFTVLCFPPTLLSLTGDCPPTTFFWKNLELLDNESECFNPKTL